MAPVPQPRPRRVQQRAGRPRPSPRRPHRAGLLRAVLTAREQEEHRPQAQGHAQPSPAHQDPAFQLRCPHVCVVRAPPVPAFSPHSGRTAAAPAGEDSGAVRLPEERGRHGRGCFSIPSVFLSCLAVRLNHTFLNSASSSESSSRTGQSGHQRLGGPGSPQSGPGCSAGGVAAKPANTRGVCLRRTQTLCRSEEQVPRVQEMPALRAPPPLLNSPTHFQTFSLSVEFMFLLTSSCDSRGVCVWGGRTG